MVARRGPHVGVDITGNWTEKKRRRRQRDVVMGWVGVGLCVTVTVVVVMEAAVTSGGDLARGERKRLVEEDEEGSGGEIAADTTTGGPLKIPKKIAPLNLGHIKPTDQLAKPTLPLQQQTDNLNISRDKITFTLCTWSGDEEGFPRVEMLLNSLKKFMEPSSVLEVILIVPERDIEYFRSHFLTQKTIFALRLVSDESLTTLTKQQQRELVPKSELKENGGRGENYRMQMLLKLLVAKVVRSEFYVTLDNDVFLKRPTNYTDLVLDGKAIVQGRETGRHRASWWASSGTVVQSPHDCGSALAKDNFQIGVTPAILHRHSVSSLLISIEKRHQKSGFDRALFTYLTKPGAGDWTEYTLYWSYLCTQNWASLFHVKASDRRLYDTSGFAWSSFDSYDVDAVFNDNSTFFGVVQSISGAPSTEVIKALSPRFV